MGRHVNAAGNKNSLDRMLFFDGNTFVFLDWTFSFRASGGDDPATDLAVTAAVS